MFEAIGLIYKCCLVALGKSVLGTYTEYGGR